MKSPWVPVIPDRMDADEDFKRVSIRADVFFSREAATEPARDEDFWGQFERVQAGAFFTIGCTRSADVNSLDIK